MTKKCEDGDRGPSRQEHAELFGDAAMDDEAVDAGIASVAWNQAWIPIGKFMRSVMVLDLAPTPEGTPGQIFVAHSDDDSRTLLARSFADLVARYFRELQDGTIDLDGEDEPPDSD